jgi:GNAT superfamily N-acetyltransferase
MVVIDPLSSGDLDSLKPLWLEECCRRTALAQDIALTHDSESSWSILKQRFQAALNNGGGYVASEAGCVVGYAVWQDERMPWPAAFATPPRLAVVLALTIARDNGGGDIGIRLLNAIEQDANSRNFRELMVSLLAADDGARAFFEKQGYMPKWLMLTCFGQELSLPAVDGSLVEPVDLSEVDALEPVWVSVHHVHRAVAPQLAPFVSDAETWRVYSRTFRPSAEQGLLFRVGPSKTPLAMGCASMLEDHSRLTDVWNVDGPFAEIEVLAALPSERGKRHGLRLMTRLRDVLRARGIPNLVIGVVAANSDAIRLYRRWGFQPALLQLTKWCG